MRDPKRQHFVPASYLSGFSEDCSDYLHVFDKKRHTFRRQLPREIFHRRYYNRQPWAPEGKDPHIFEIKLGQEQEPKGLNALKQLLTCPEKLGEEDMVNILVYLNLQRIRVPRQASTVKFIYKSSLEEAIRRHPIGQDVLSVAEIVVNDSFRFDYMRTMHDFFVPYFSRMVWTIVTAKNGASFITSDSPVSFYNDSVLPPSEPGIALYGTRVLFPITKKHLLILTHPEFESRERSATEQIVEEVSIRDSTIEVRSGAICGGEFVTTHNRVMFLLSQEGIAGDREEVLRDAIQI